MNKYVGESGPEFEKRGLALARALHDPMGVQGSVMFRGSERDGLFIGHDDIHAYEFSVASTKDKAIKDGQKIAELLGALSQAKENAFKSRTGWFVTLNEPTAEQRSAVQGISKKTGERVHAVSISTLHQRICNSETYLQARDNAPFGSINYGARPSRRNIQVPIQLVDPDGKNLDLGGITDWLIQGKRALLVGNYGVGKSHTLREVYRALRKEHFRRNKLTPFPVHINLRDCVGLNSPAEVLRRHAEEIGFDHSSGLISAWRAGSCILLLDGFDEVVPSRWFGGASDLERVRWDALAAIRRLIKESPLGSGVIIAGRSHYFSNQGEMLQALGFNAFEIFNVPDFTENQVNDFLNQAGVEWSIPDWVPVRPLLLGYLVDISIDEAEDVAVAVTRASGWRRFLKAICEREAEMVNSVRPETIEAILSRVATLARSHTDVTGPISRTMLDAAYVSVNGVHPDEEGTQVLLRLPGLASAEGNSEEARVFVDRDLAEAAYGLDLASYAVNPYENSHPLASTASWAIAADDLAIEVASDSLVASGVDFRGLAAAIVARDNSDNTDAVMADLVRTSIEFPSPGSSLNRSIVISGIYFEALTIPDHPMIGSCTFESCVFEVLDLSGVDESADLPSFQSCVIGKIDGLASIPGWLTPFLSDCEIQEFSKLTQTTAGILQLDMDRERRVAITILKKIFGQRGSSRKESALSRGLSLSDRPLVPEVIDRLIAGGWLARSSAGNSVIYVGVKGRKKDAMHVLESPADFSF